MADLMHVWLRYRKITRYMDIVVVAMNRYLGDTGPRIEG